MAKRVMDNNITGLRPKISARRPLRGKMAVLDRAYADPTQTYSLPPCRSSVMVGSAVPTAVKSRADNKVERRTAKKVSQKAAPFPALLTSVVEVEGEDVISLS